MKQSTKNKKAQSVALSKEAKFAVLNKTLDEMTDVNNDIFESRDTARTFALECIRRSLNDEGMGQDYHDWLATLEEGKVWDVLPHRDSVTKHEAINKAIDKVNVDLMSVYLNARTTAKGKGQDVDPNVDLAIKEAIVGTVDTLESAGGVNLRYTHQGQTHLTVMDGLGESFMNHFDNVNS